jgi:hypothetical protein
LTDDWYRDITMLTYLSDAVKHLRRNNLPKLICLLLACFSLVACAKPEPDRSYLESVPCAAPCWQGITPGITDETTAMAILSDPDLVFQDTLRCQNHADNPSRRGCLFRRLSNEGGQIGFEHGIVRGIALNSEITLDEAITALGPPDFIKARHGSQLLYEGKCYNAHAYYLKGIRLWIGGCEPIEVPFDIVLGNNLVIYPTMEVGSLDFFQPGDSVEEILQNAFGHSNIERYLNNIQPWVGYGQYPLPADE